MSAATKGVARTKAGAPTIISRFLVLGAAMVMLTGCALTTDSRELQSQFTFPNSDLEAVGRVHSEMSRTTWLNPLTMDKAVWDRLAADAMQEKGGDGLIDFIVTAKIKIYPLFFYETTFALDGTAVRARGGGPGQQNIR